MTLKTSLVIDSAGRAHLQLDVFRLYFHSVIALLLYRGTRFPDTSNESKLSGKFEGGGGGNRWALPIDM